MSRPVHRASQYVSAPPRNGLGTAALCLAVIGLVFGFIPNTGFIVLILGVAAVIVGEGGTRRVRCEEATNRKTATSGVVLGLVVALIGLVSVVLAGLFTSGGSTTTVASPLSSVPATGTVSPVGPTGAGIATGRSTPADRSEADTVYLSAVHARSIEGSDGALISTAKNVCAYLDEGRSTADVKDYVNKRHNTNDFKSLVVVGAGVHSYCPGHTRDLTSR